MHSKRKGNIGQTVVCQELAKHGFSTFIEFGDISKIDIIAEKDGKLIRIQCKAATPKKGAICLPLKKSGPNYQFKYQKHQFDFFALIDLVTYKVYLISSSILDNIGNLITLRLTKTKNNQNVGIHNAEDYLFDKILRDFTRDTKSDDKVQTTTEMANEN